MSSAEPECMGASRCSEGFGVCGADAQQLANVLAIEVAAQTFLLFFLSQFVDLLYEVVELFHHTLESCSFDIY